MKIISLLNARNGDSFVRETKKGVQLINIFKVEITDLTANKVLAKGRVSSKEVKSPSLPTLYDIWKEVTAIVNL